MLPSEISLTVPGWLGEELGRLPSHLPGLEDRMAAVIRFSQLNFERGSGGPFAAGFGERQGRVPAERGNASQCPAQKDDVLGAQGTFGSRSPENAFGLLETRSHALETEHFGRAAE
jgi:hypothetical protein